MTQDKNKKLLDKIHHSIKKRFVYRRDYELWDKVEHWERYDQIPNTGIIHGDCDCFALACRKECRKLGIRSRLVYCKVGDTGHLVLESDGWILDNRYDQVVANTFLNYNWISISGYDRGDDWYIITGFK